MSSSACPLRIAQLIESDGPGGAEQVVVDLATSFQASGAPCVVFVPAHGEGWLERRLAGSGVAVEHFELNRPFSIACARGLAAALRRRRIDVVHSHEFSMAFYGAWAARLAGVPHVITMHGGRYYAGHMRRRLALRLALAFSDRMVAVSHRLAADLRRDLRVAASRVSVLPNGVRAERAHPGTVRDELGLGPGDRLLVSVGNLYPVKGHRHLIDALGLLRERNHEPHLAIAGRGDLADALTARAHHLGLAGRVHLLGLRSDIPALLAAADAFVLPSLSEGLPLALLEAMFAGCPIVASEVGEVGAALGDGEAGLLVPAGDSAALATSLEKVLADPARAREMGERAARRAATEYDIAQMVRRYGALYEAARRHAEPSPGLGGLTQDAT